jgi:hypothetical protein
MPNMEFWARIILRGLASSYKGAPPVVTVSAASTVEEVEILQPLAAGFGEIHEGRTTIALVGKVYCEVDADADPIAIGDLLTSSDTPGHAMRVSDPLKGFGSVLGKALRPMASGRGFLPILVGQQ